MGARLAVLGLAEGEGDIFVLDHVLDLLPHCSAQGQYSGWHVEGYASELTGQDKENDPVHDQDGPEDGDVEDLEPAAQEGDNDGAGGGVPELELGKAADEGAELLVLLGGETSGATIFHVHGAIEGLD